jgi:hypothetical protein
MEFGEVSDAGQRREIESGVEVAIDVLDHRVYVAGVFRLAATRAARGDQRPR